MFGGGRRGRRTADDLREAQKLYSQGKYQPALDKVEAFLKAEPRDPQGRFLKGLVLTEQKRTNEAIQVFTGLTEDFPELPEPYNNLAVLYASQGNYDKAKSALELAIHTHPSYATAHENLGDIYAQLASRAYDRALQLDKNNTTRAGEARHGEGAVQRRSRRGRVAGSEQAGTEDGGAESRAAQGRAAAHRRTRRPRAPKTQPKKVAKLEPKKPAKAEPKKPASLAPAEPACRRPRRSPSSRPPSRAGPAPGARRT